MSPPLEHLELAMDANPGPLLPQVRQVLAERLGPDAEALRWAITGVASPATATAPARLTLEAVVLRMPL
jgi:hypothetical protein